MNRLLIQGAIALLVTLIFRYVAKKARGLEVAKSFKDLGKKHKYYSLAYLFILGPTVEELVFRFPLIVIFNKMTSWAWLATVGTAVFFAYLHWDSTFKKELSFSDQVSNEERERVMSLPIEEAEKVIKEVKIPLGMKIVSFTSASVMGVVCSYFGITGRSLFTSIIIHSLWNISGAILIPLLVSLGALLFYFFKEVVFMKR
jgi:membrane protease YdiL (CAAX protease family)